MLSNTISVSYDALGDAQSVEKTYTRYDEYQNRTVYVGENHSPIDKDTLTFYRSFPKQVGNYKGVAKTSFKISKDVEVPGVDGLATFSSPVIIEVTFSVPLGVTDAEALRLRHLASSILSSDSLMVSVTKQLQI